MKILWKWKKRSEKKDTLETKKRQLINKQKFHWGLIITAISTLLPMVLNLSYSDFFRGFYGGLFIWFILLFYMVRLEDMKRISKSLLNGFLIGKAVIVIPMLFTYCILIALGQEEFVAGAFGFFVSLASFSIANLVLSVKVHQINNELHELELAARGFRPIEELQKNQELHK